MFKYIIYHFAMVNQIMLCSLSVLEYNKISVLFTNNLHSRLL